MNEPQHIDPERLAALLDGRLGNAEAAAVRAQLAASDEDTLAAYADAIAVTNEMAVPGVRPIAAAPARRWVVPSFSAAAAAIIVAVLLFPALSGNAYAPIELANALSSRVQPTSEQMWSAMRGASSTGVSPRARATRVGALLTDVEVGARTNHIEVPARAIAALFDDVAGGAGVATVFRQLADAFSATPQARVEAGRLVLDLVDEDFATAGAWLEAARLAAAARDVGFFERHPATAIEPLARSKKLSASETAAMQHLVALTNAKPRDAAAIQLASEDLLRALAH